MKLCPVCNSQYPDDANFCPQESCATGDGPRRLIPEKKSQDFGRFQVADQLGGRRTGSVYRALDTQTGKQVALKIIPGSVLPTPAVFARAEREFKQLVRVASPKIASILECSKTGNGELLVAMEWCEGETLEKVLERGPIDFDTSKSIILQVGQALLEAQKAGLVHRDIAPKNIIIAPGGDLKVINFPVAKALNEKISGTLQYLAPEQIQGKPIDQRTNTYNLAALFYHLMTGEPPFYSQNEAAVLEMHLSSPLLPPSQRKPSGGIPVELDRIILKAMDKSSSRRHLTLRLFLAETEGVKPSAPLPVAPAAAPQPALAKTMMFGGNQADVARMVAEAKAAKSASQKELTSPPPASIQPANPSPPVAEVAPNFQSSVANRPNASSALASMPTIAVQSGSVVPTAPAAAAVIPPAASPSTVAPASVQIQPEPAPVVTAPQSRPPAPSTVDVGPAATPISAQPVDSGKAATNKAGAAFRETLWFKKGDVEQMVADAKAKLQSQGKAAGENPAELPEDVRLLEDRYIDDGSVTVEDRKKFSLRTGGTATALPTTGSSVPGEKIDEKELVGEIGTGRRTIILIIAAAIILSLVVVFVMLMKGKEGGEGKPGDETRHSATPLPTPTSTSIAQREEPTPPAAKLAGGEKVDAKPMVAPSAATPSAASPADKKEGDGEDGDAKVGAKKKGSKQRKQKTR